MGSIYFHIQKTGSWKDKYFAKIPLFLPMAWSIESKESWSEDIFKMKEFSQTAHVYGTKLSFLQCPLGLEPSGVCLSLKFVYISGSLTLPAQATYITSPEKWSIQLKEVGWWEVGSLNSANSMLYNIKGLHFLLIYYYCKQFKALLCLIWSIKDTNYNTLFFYNCKH